MPENSTFTTVRYDRPADPSYDLMPGVSELPEITVKVGDATYFADSSGYLMLWNGRRAWVEKSDSWVVVSENVAWGDDVRFEGNVPDEIKAANEAIAVALTVLHGINRDAVIAAYEE